MKFELGKTVLTAGIVALANAPGNYPFVTAVMAAIQRYIRCDWGELEEEDKAMNDAAVKNGDDRILATYDCAGHKIYIITETDRSVTTILVAEEY